MFKRFVLCGVLGGIAIGLVLQNPAHLGWYVGFYGTLIVVGVAGAVIIYGIVRLFLSQLPH